MLGYFRSLLRLPGAVHLYLLSEMLFGLAIGMTLVLNFYYTDLQLSPTVIGQGLALYSVTVALCSYPAGIFTDRFGAKTAMTLGGALIVLGYLLTSQIQGPLSLFLAQFVLAVGMAFIFTCEFPYIMSLCERKEDETTAFNLLIAAFQLTMGLGQILGTKLPGLLPFGTTPYQPAVYLIAAAFFIMWLMRLFLPAKSQRAAREEAARDKHRSWKMIPSRQVVIYVIFGAIAGFIWNLVGPFENLILRERFTLPDEWIGYLFAVNSLLLFITSLLAPYLMLTKGRRLYLYAAFGVLTISFFILGSQVPLYLFTLFLLGKGVSQMLVTSFIDSSMMKATPEDERGMHAGLRHLTRAGAGAAASWLAGYLVGQQNYHTVYFLAFLSAAIWLLYYFLFVRRQLIEDLEEKF